MREAETVTDDLFAQRIPEPKQTLVRNSDPPTSHAAAEAIRGKPCANHRLLILGVMWRPMTQYEIAKCTGLDRYQVNKRLSELARDNPDTGYQAEIEDTGTMRPGESGRDCIVWAKR